MGFQNFSLKAWHGILRSNAAYNIWDGPVRSGKTYSTLYRWIQFVRNAPRGDLVMIGKTLDTLQSNIIDPLIDIVGIKNAVYKRGSRKFTLFGRQCTLRGAGDESSEQKIRGSTYAGAYGDELTLWPESFWNMLSTRLSIPGATFFGTTNPDSPKHWLKKNWIDKRHEFNADARAKGHRDYLRNFHFELDDNPSLTAEYLDSLKRSYTGLWHRRFIKGEWCLADGAIWDGFDDTRHVIDIKKAFPDGFRHYHISGDYGTANATALYIIGYNSRKGPYFVVGEYYFDSRKRGFQKTDKQYGKDLGEFVKKHNLPRKPEMVYIDPSAASFITELRSRSWYVTEANNSVVDGLRFVNSQFASDNLFIDKRCTSLLEEIPDYVWDAKAQARGEDKPLKVDDHGCDGLRYGIYSPFGKGASGVLGGYSR